jgi:ABC-type polysaccharide transport system permease subunit
MKDINNVHIFLETFLDLPVYKYFSIFWKKIGVRDIVFNATVNNISVIIYCGSQFIGGGNRNTWRKQQTCHKSH